MRLGLASPVLRVVGLIGIIWWIVCWWGREKKGEKLVGLFFVVVIWSERKFVLLITAHLYTNSCSHVWSLWYREKTYHSDESLLWWSGMIRTQDRDRMQVISITGIVQLAMVCISIWCVHASAVNGTKTPPGADRRKFRDCKYSNGKVVGGSKPEVYWINLNSSILRRKAIGEG